MHAIMLCAGNNATIPQLARVHGLEDLPEENLIIRNVTATRDGVDLIVDACTAAAASLLGGEERRANTTLQLPKNSNVASFHDLAGAIKTCSNQGAVEDVRDWGILSQGSPQRVRIVDVRLDRGDARQSVQPGLLGIATIRNCPILALICNASIKSYRGDS